MRGLPGWLTGTRTGIVPDPSTHVDFTAEALLSWVENGGKVRLVAFPGVDADVHPLGGNWPLVLRVSADGPGGVAVVTEDRPDCAYYLNATDMVTVAPAELPQEEPS